MAFNSAKGVLVVDPIEGHSIAAGQYESIVYSLFQIGTIVQRSKHCTYNKQNPKWNEDSKTRFDIEPNVIPVLKVFVMEKSTKLVPRLIGKGEVNLIDVFYQRRADRWIHLKPSGRINVELTFYQMAPLIPQKIQTLETTEATNKLSEKPQDKEQLKVQKMISSVDQVFEDEQQEEKSRLWDLAKKVKRRYKHSLHHYIHRETLEDKSDIDTNDNLLFFEANEKELPPTPTSKRNSHVMKPEPETVLDRPSNDINRRVYEASNFDLQIDDIPFSADTIGSHDTPLITEKLESANLREREELLTRAYVPLSTESFTVVRRLERGNAKLEDFKVDPGASEYHGDGTWGKIRLRDIWNVGETPKIPPKVPLGMTPEEYSVLYLKEFIEYYKVTLS